MSEISIFKIFEKQVSVIPNKLAYVDALTNKSFIELYNDAYRIAIYLSSNYSLNLKTIALISSKCYEFYSSMLAVVQCGCVYLPLSNNTPKDRISYILKDAACPIVLTDSKSNIPDNYDGVVITFDEIKSFINSSKTTISFQNNIHNDNLYIMYTSGTTGIPNGVLIPHSGVIRLAQNNTYLPLNESHVFLHHSNISFDASTFEIWCAWLNGFPVVVEENIVANLSLLHNKIKQHRITTVFFTTSFFNLLVDEFPEIFKDLNHVSVGGETLSPKHLKTAIESAPETNFYNVYGPTETTTFATCFKIPKDFNFEKYNAIPIGEAIAETSVYVLNDNLEIVENNIPGELYIGGKGLAVQYINQPTITAEKFINHPILKERIYKTGDKVYQDNEGKIWYLSRVDNQVKIRGFRVELGEVEQCFRDKIKNLDLRVIDYFDGFEKKLIAYVKTNKDENNDLIYWNENDRKIITNEISNWLPEYMHPAEYLGIAKFPLNQNGKLDAALLRKLTDSFYESHSNYSTESKDAVMNKIIQIWKNLFHKQDINGTDNFHQIGGNSLLALRMIFELNKSFNKNFSATIINSIPTPILQCKYIIEEDINNDEKVSLKLIKPGVGEPLFIFPGAWGKSYQFFDFAFQLGVSNPIYIFSFPSFKTNEFNNLKELSNICFQLINNLKPIKLFMLGYSIGGTIALEVGIEMQKKGLKTEFFTVLDATIPDKFLHSESSRLKRELLYFIKSPLMDKFNYFHYRILKRNSFVKEYIKPNQNTLFEQNNELDYDQINKNHHPSEILKTDLLLIKSDISQHSKSSITYYYNAIYKDLNWGKHIKGSVNIVNLRLKHIEFSLIPGHSEVFNQLREKLQQ